MVDPRWRALRAAAAELALVTRPDDVRATIAALVEPTIGTRAVAIAVPDGAGNATMTVVTSPSAGFEGGSRTIPNGTRHPIVDTMRDGDSRLFESLDALVAAYPELAERATRSGDQAWAHVALRHDDRILGAIGVAFREPTTLDAEDEDRYREFALVCLAAVERARLYEAEEVSRRDAERATEVAYALGSAAIGAAAGATPADVARSVLEVGIPLVGARAGAIAIATPGGAEIHASGFTTPPRLVGGDPGDAAAVAERRFLTDRAEIERAAPAWASDPALHDVEALAVIPLSSAGTPVGSFVLAFDRPRTFDEDDRRTISALASICSQAIGRARHYEAEHAISLALQHGLLRHTVPPLPGVRIASRYLPAYRRLEVGGDWHQAIPLADGRVGLAVGDVVGKGAEAASTMGQLRSALAGAALSRPEPEDVLASLRRSVALIPGAETATLAYAVVDASDGSVRYVRAGHPYPFLVGADRGVTRLEGGGTLPLFAWDTSPVAVATASIAPGDRLFLYTDGLVERRDSAIDEGIDELERLLDEVRPADADAVCDLVLDTFFSNEPPRDDVAMLCAEVVAT